MLNVSEAEKNKPAEQLDHRSLCFIFLAQQSARGVSESCSFSHSVRTSFLQESKMAALSLIAPGGGVWSCLVCAGLPETGKRRSMEDNGSPRGGGGGEGMDEEAREGA